MSFSQMKRDDLYELATENFAVDVDERATKPQIIAALAENGVTWEMAKTFDQNAAAIAETDDDIAEESAPAAGVITAASVNPEATKVSVDPVEIVETVVEEDFIRVPRDVDGYVRNNVFVPSEPEPAVVPAQVTPVQPGVVLLKMERENPRYEVRGHKFTRDNPFALVKESDADYILQNVEGFKVASPREAKEFYS